MCKNVLKQQVYQDGKFYDNKQEYVLREKFLIYPKGAFPVSPRFIYNINFACQQTLLVKRKDRRMYSLCDERKRYKIPCPNNYIIYTSRHNLADC